MAKKATSSGSASARKTAAKSTESALRDSTLDAAQVEHGGAVASEPAGSVRHEIRIDL